LTALFKELFFYSLPGAARLMGTLTDGFFEQVAYRGAFDATTDWTAQWAVWGL
jgi:hypothetical protein